MTVRQVDAQVWEQTVDGFSSWCPPSSFPNSQTSHSLQSCPPGPQVNGCADYPQVLDARQIWALSSVSVGHPSKPFYRIGACQLAQLAFGKPPGVSHGTSFALMVPDKPGSSVMSAIAGGVLPVRPTDRRTKMQLRGRGDIRVKEMESGSKDPWVKITLTF